MHSMNFFSVAVLLASFSLGTHPPRTPDSKEAPKAVRQLQGKWAVKKTVFNGINVPEAQLKNRYLVFTEKSFVAFKGGQRGRTVKYELDTKTTSPQIRLTTKGVRAPALGIILVDRNNLKICYGEPGAKRPKEFKSEAGKRVFLLELKRVESKE